MKSIIRKSIIWFLSVIFVLDVLMLCLWVHSFHYCRPYGNDEVGLSDVLYVSYNYEANELCSDKDLYPLLKECRFRGLNLISGLKLFHDTSEIDEISVFSIHNTDKNITTERERGREHHKITESFYSAFLIKRGDELYLQCNYLSPKYKWSDDRQQLAYYRIINENDSLLAEVENRSEKNRELVFDEENERIENYILALSFVFRVFCYYLAASPIKYVLMSYFILAVCVWIFVCVVLINKQKKTKNGTHGTSDPGITSPK